MSLSFGKRAGARYTGGGEGTVPDEDPRLTPEYESWIAVISCPRSIDVASFEVADLDETILGRFGMVTLDL